MSVVIFGSGNFGRRALHSMGSENIEYFIDNDPRKHGMKCEDKRIISMSDYLGMDGRPHIVIAINDFEEVSELLQANGVFDYEIYVPNLWEELLKLREFLKGVSGEVALLGIEQRSKIVLQSILSAGIAPERIILTDILFSDEPRRLIESYEFVSLDEAVGRAEYLVVSSQMRAYMLQTYMKQNYPYMRVLNPYVMYQYGDNQRLIMNPYDGTNHDITEQEWMSQTDSEEKRNAIQLYMVELNRNLPLFEHIEIETYNRCNGVCDFCPVSVGNDKRISQYMSEELFYSIIDQLQKMNYFGRLATFSNNEPFLDKRIVSFNKYARDKLPNARLHLFTNGTVLGLEDFICIMQYLDELVIDNYNQELKLIPTVKTIAEYCEQHPEMIEKVTIVTRKPHEIRTSRGGDAPNRSRTNYLADFGCVLPFKQLIVRPDGKVSLCCNDPYGKYTLGDLSTQSLQDIWYGDKFVKVREAMLDGRKNFGDCQYCDTVLLF